uniref:MIF4G-like type 2 domain-containing protein n=1 Tax=Euplotes harpa TaxID=151035 RepID=A0A7S3J7U1_9SPIT|mmetsp:Transcript_20032/g.23228  ORF Transcript_20032/g.23228 Transcript_20032/m.23228 type:complete len:241 (+) Transcript_20032:177-899(+)
MSSIEGSSTVSEFNVESSGFDFIEIFMECLLYKSQKSLIHLKKLATRFLTIIKNTLSDEQSQAKACEVVSNVWCNNEQKEISIFDQLLNLGIISPLTMIKYIFERIRVIDHTKNMYAKEWKILHKLVSKQLIKFHESGRDNSGNQLFSQNDEMEDADLLHKDETLHEQNEKLILTTIFESFDVCIQNLQESSSQPVEGQGNQEDKSAAIPLEKRIENITNRRKALLRRLSQIPLIKSFVS